MLDQIRNTLDTMPVAVIAFAGIPLVWFNAANSPVLNSRLSALPRREVFKARIGSFAASVLSGAALGTAVLSGDDWRLPFWLGAALFGFAAILFARE